MHVLLSHHRTAGRNRDREVANRLFENVPQFRYLRRTVTNRNLIQEEFKSTLKSGNA
jgi:hypothetical protein